MAAEHSDALVFFGATGDLAHKEIFHRHNHSTARFSGSFRSRPSAASIIFLEKNPFRTFSTFGLQTHFSNLFGIATISRACRSPWPRTSASQAAADSMKKLERFV